MEIWSLLDSSQRPQDFEEKIRELYTVLFDNSSPDTNPDQRRKCDADLPRQLLELVIQLADIDVLFYGEDSAMLLRIYVDKIQNGEDLLGSPAGALYTLRQFLLSEENSTPNHLVNKIDEILTRLGVNFDRLYNRTKDSF